ncbi:exosome complex protein Rrp42 [Candidatus Woesearchaeota archaeon]|nr:exosome complex protein Rrp42 [Candidatus Woesearchaeota archaeon]
MSRNAPNSKEHIVKALEADIRYDGRKKEEFRKIEIETDIAVTGEGSARVKVGDCEVIAGVKLSLGTPYPDSPDEGVLMVGCELIPMAHPSLESGPPSIDAIEIGRVIDRGIREGHCIDAKQLCVEPGEKVWIVSVDVVPLNHDGNLIDVGGLAAMAAIKATRFPVIEDGKVNYKELTDKKLEINETPIPVTVCKIGNQLFVDPTKVEEDAIEARITVTCLDDKRICSLQKGGSESFSIEQLGDAFDIASKTSNELRKNL